MLLSHARSSLIRLLMSYGGLSPVSNPSWVSSPTTLSKKASRRDIDTLSVLVFASANTTYVARL